MSEKTEKPKNEKYVGKFVLVLHAHLPWVLGHGNWPHGTNWIYEAASETYIPILKECDKLINDGFAPHFTIDISPVLCEMLASDTFKTGFIDYCENKIEWAKKDYEEFEARKDLSETERKNYLTMAKWWEDFYKETIRYFKEDCNYEILSKFKKLQDDGYIDITTCAATHGYSPLLSRESSIHAQFKTAVNNYKKHFGREPMGTWLPECAYRPGYVWKKPITYDGKEDSGRYRPGVEKFLSRNGIKYFFVDTAMLMGGTAQGVYAARFPLLKRLYEQMKKEIKDIETDFVRSPYEVYLTASKDAENPVAFFTRDENTGILVWSGEHGYPATGGAYLDFHKRHYKDSMGGGSGLRYWKVTSPKADLGSKMQYYMPDIAELLDQNAGHFKEAVKGVLRDYKREHAGKTGILVAPYDAELFGHWWFEGVWFLNRLVRFFAMDPEVDMITARQYLEENGMPDKIVQLAEGSWGQGGSHYIWLNKDTKWTWPKIYEIEDIVEDLVTKFHDKDDETLQRLLKQLCRENLLLQASDWQFLISTWSARDYAESRFSIHYENCQRIANMIDRYTHNEEITEGEWKFLAEVEKADHLFPEIDISAWVKDDWKESIDNE